MEPLFVCSIETAVSFDKTPLLVMAMNVRRQRGKRLDGISKEYWPEHQLELAFDGS